MPAVPLQGHCVFFPETITNREQYSIVTSVV